MDTGLLLLVCCAMGILVGAQMAQPPRTPPTFVFQIEPESPRGNGCLGLLFFGGLVLMTLLLLSGR